MKKSAAMIRGFVSLTLCVLLVAVHFIAKA